MPVSLAQLSAAVAVAAHTLQSRTGETRHHSTSTTTNTLSKVNTASAQVSVQGQTKQVLLSPATPSLCLELVCAGRVVRM